MLRRILSQCFLWTLLIICICICFWSSRPLFRQSFLNAATLPPTSNPLTTLYLLSRLSLYIHL